LHLPAFQKLDTPGNVEDFGSADRSLLIFLGSGTLHPQAGSPILENNNVKVLDASGLVPGTRIAWDGSGTVFICRREPLIFRSATEIPPAGLLDEPATISLGLYNGDKNQSGAFFLKNSELQIIARPKSTGPQQTLPFQFTAMGKFQGSLALAEAGEYHLSARLRAPYGDLEQSLGDFRVSATAVDLPTQVTLDTFPGVPGRLLASKMRSGLLLPIGSGQVTIPDVAGIRVSPSVVTILPNHPETISLFVSTARPAGEIIQVPYKVTWNNGVRTTEADSILRVAVRRLTLGEVFRALWMWISLAFSLILVLTLLISSFAPRNLRGKLQIRKEGKVLYSLILPSDLRSRRLQIKADPSTQSVTRSGAIVNVPSETDGLLLTIESKRHNGRWTAVVTPGSSRVQAAGQNLFGTRAIADVPRSQLLIPSFNLTITFR
jgi:hypothetical protein